MHILRFALVHILRLAHWSIDPLKVFKENDIINIIIIKNNRYLRHVD